MKYKIIVLLFFSIYLLSCSEVTIYEPLKSESEFYYKNKGFALIYDEKFSSIKKLDSRSLNIYHKTLNKRSIVKITNPFNDKFIIAEVKSNKVKFSNFYNLENTKELELDINEPYIEIVSIGIIPHLLPKSKNVWGRKKTVVERPVDGIQIKDLNPTKKGDFYYKTTVETMKKQLQIEHQ